MKTKNSDYDGQTNRNKTKMVENMVNTDKYYYYILNKKILHMLFRF